MYVNRFKWFLVWSILNLNSFKFARIIIGAEMWVPVYQLDAPHVDVEILQAIRLEHYWLGARVMGMWVISTWGSEILHRRSWWEYSVINLYAQSGLCGLYIPSLYARNPWGYRHLLRIKYKILRFGKCQWVKSGEHTGDTSHGVPSWGQRQRTIFRLNYIILFLY